MSCSLIFSSSSRCSSSSLVLPCITAHYIIKRAVAERRVFTQTLTHLFLFPLCCCSGVCSADQGAERLQGAAAGEGGRDLRAQSGEEQHQGECGSGLIIAHPVQWDPKKQKTVYFKVPAHTHSTTLWKLHNLHRTHLHTWIDSILRRLKLSGGYGFKAVEARKQPCALSVSNARHTSLALHISA